MFANRALTFLAVLSIIVPAAVPARVAAAEASCDELRVVSGNNRFVPSTVKFSLRTSQPAAPYTFYFGDGQQETSATPEVSHAYDVSGTFTARAYAGSSSCQVIFSLLPSPLESQKSGCSNVFILGPNFAPVDTEVRFLVTGYDNKSGISQYTIDFGNGQEKESNVGTFSHTYNAPGTYTVRGYINDSKNVEKGGDASCQVPLYITGQPIETQPDTGTPTLFTAAALFSALCLFIIARKNYFHR